MKCLLCALAAFVLVSLVTGEINSSVVLRLSADNTSSPRTYYTTAVVGSQLLHFQVDFIASVSVLACSTSKSVPVGMYNREASATASGNQKCGTSICDSSAVGCVNSGNFCVAETSSRDCCTGTGPQSFSYYLGPVVWDDFSLGTVGTSTTANASVNAQLYFMCYYADQPNYNFEKFKIPADELFAYEGSDFIEPAPSPPVDLPPAWYSSSDVMQYDAPAAASTGSSPSNGLAATASLGSLTQYMEKSVSQEGGHFYGGLAGVLALNGDNPGTFFSQVVNNSFVGAVFSRCLGQNGGWAVIGNIMPDQILRLLEVPLQSSNPGTIGARPVMDLTLKFDLAALAVGSTNIQIPAVSLLAYYSSQLQGVSDGLRLSQDLVEAIMPALEKVLPNNVMEIELGCFGANTTLPELMDLFPTLSLTVAAPNRVATLAVPVRPDMYIFPVTLSADVLKGLPKTSMLPTSMVCMQYVASGFVGVNELTSITVGTSFFDGLFYQVDYDAGRVLVGQPYETCEGLTFSGAPADPIMIS